MKSGNSDLNYCDLIGLCMDFFEAGGETVGSTMSWVLMYMAMNQEEQEKCYQEISAKLGEREPTLEDKALLPYCDAFTMEVQRMSCVAPGGIGFQLREKKIIEGYELPKGKLWITIVLWKYMCLFPYADTLISYNIHKFHTDVGYWNDPEVFRPDRFLSDDGLRVRKPDRFVPFGFGRRICMGESLAKTELFLFAIIFMQASVDHFILFSSTVLIFKIYSSFV